MTDFILKSPEIRNMLQLTSKKKKVLLLMWLSDAKYLNLTCGTIKIFELVKTSNEKASY